MIVGAVPFRHVDQDVTLQLDPPGRRHRAMLTVRRKHDALIERAPFTCGRHLAANTVVSDRLITGQNPASATGVAEALVARLTELTSVR
jgi:hypothetical protein